LNLSYSQIPGAKSARVYNPGGSPETGLKKPGDEEKPLKADSSASESKEARLKAGMNERKSYETPKDQEQW